jgi:hypothetical protein
LGILRSLKACTVEQKLKNWNRSFTQELIMVETSKTRKRQTDRIEKMKIKPITFQKKQYRRKTKTFTV